MILMHKVAARGKPIEWASAPHPNPLPVKNGEREQNASASLLTYDRNAA
jgi:hypothetical protein